MLLAGAVVAGGTFAPLADKNADFDTASRSDAASIKLPSPVAAIRTEPTSQMLRAPTGIADKDAKAQDLAGLVTQALEALGHSSTSADDLHALVLQMLAEGQSDAYIDAVLNAGFARGAFGAPDSLVNSDGKLDTDKLLNALVQVAST